MNGSNADQEFAHPVPSDANYSMYDLDDDKDDGVIEASIH